jgi:hypothetical protein
VIKEVGGKVTETTTDSTHVGNTVVNTVQDTQVKVQTQVKTEIVYKDKIIEKEKIVDNTKRSRWDIGVGVGYGLTDTTTIIPGLSKNLVVTADVSYKILGPFSVGVWGSTRKDIGAMVRIGF